MNGRRLAILTFLEPRVLSTLAIHNYRSLRDLVLPLGRLNVVTGLNGSGKSNV